MCFVVCVERKNHHVFSFFPLIFPGSNAVSKTCSFVAPKLPSQKATTRFIVIIIRYSSRCSLISLENGEWETIQRRDRTRFDVLDSARERNKNSNTGKFLEKTENPRVEKERERERDRKRGKRKRERREKWKKIWLRKNKARAYTCYVRRFISSLTIHRWTFP